MSKVYFHYVLLIWLLLSVACGSNSIFSDDYNPCKDRIKKAERELGVPDSVNEYESGDNHSYKMQWNNYGLSYTYRWGQDYTGCEKSTFKFDAFKIVLKCTKCR